MPLRTEILPWVPDRAERRQAGAWQWWGFAPGDYVRCPVCAGKLSQFGMGLAVSVRLHPRQADPVPSSRHGEARQCGGCRQYIDMAFRDVDAEGRAA
jgi:hypothetical protein